MNILALDTVTDACSVAVLKDQKKFGRRVIVPQAHTQIILDLCDEILQESGLTKDQLDLIVCGRGPGSFTGVRIGIAVAQGLAFGLGLKALGVSNLQTMAQSVISGDSSVQRIFVANDARMGEVYYCAYENANGIAVPLMDEQVGSPESAEEKFREIGGLENAVLAGTGFEVYEPLKKTISCARKFAEDHFPDSLFMLDLAKDTLNSAVEPENLTPVYLRDKVTWKKVSEQGKKA